MGRSAAALTIAGLLLSLGTSAFNLRAQNDRRQVVIGVVQASGPLVPFARFDGFRWTNTWPEPADRVQIHGEKDYTQAGYLSVSDGHLWLQRTDQVLRLLDGGVVQSDEDRKGSTFRDSLGVLVISNRRFWISQRNGWEHEAYEMVEVLPHRIQRILKVYGGAC